MNSYFYPGTTKTGSIGTSSYMWNSVYAATIYENGTSLASKYAAIGHTHGLIHSNLNQMATNGTTGGWSVIGIDPAVAAFVLKSIRINQTSPNWLCGDYGAGIAFGGADTKGVISMRYQYPVITFAGGNHSSSKTEPTWYLKISGSSGSTYNLANFYDSTISRTANTVLAAPNGSDGTASFRKLVAADIPSLNYSKVSISRNLTSGTKVGTITIDGTATDLYCQTNTNTTYTIATGDSNGQIKVTPSSGSAYNVSVKGLGSAAYTASTSYVPINGKAPNGIGRDGYIAYAHDGFLNYGTGPVTGALVITTPFTKTKGEVMLKFTVDIFNYKNNTSVEYKISGYAYNDGKWYNSTAYCVSSGVYSTDNIDNLTVRFGYVTDGFYQVQIGETTTNKWNYPRINIHDISVAYNRTNYTDANTGWSLEFVTSGNIPNITQTIINTAQQITPISVTSSTLDTTPGTFAFFGSGAPWTGSDWCGLQVGFQDDRFQIVASNGTLAVRQNDSSGTPTTTGWTEWKTLSTTDHTHNYAGSSSVGGPATNVAIARVSKDSKVFPGANKVIFEEYTNGGNYNLPGNHYYHIMSAQGPDTNYGTQLALGMTATAAYYRVYNNKTWSDWKSLINTDTTYSANNGVGLSGTTFYNSGVRAVSTGSANGTISVNTNGTSADVAVKGLASAAYVTQESLLRARSTVSTDGGATGWSQIGINQYNGAFPDGVTNQIYGWGAVVSMPAPNARFDLYYNHNSSTAGATTNGLQYRTGWDNDKKAWRMLIDNVNYTEYMPYKKPIKFQFNNGITNGYWAKLFSANYSSYNILEIDIVTYHGYTGNFRSKLHIRFTNAGFVPGESNIISHQNIAPSSLRITQDDANTFSLWIKCDGTSSRFGYEILNISDESSVFFDGITLTAARWSFPTTFTKSDTAPTNAVTATRYFALDNHTHNFKDPTVTQTADNSSNSDSYELLISNSANNTTETAGVRKSTRLRFNPSTGRVIMQGPLIIRATDGTGQYDEGIRINAGKNGYSSLSFGGGQDTISGTADGQFWIGTNSTNDSYKRKLYIAHATSTGSGTYFYASSATQGSPALKLGTSGSIASGNGDAVTGGVVYTALSNYLPLSGGSLSASMNFKSTTYDGSAANNGVSSGISYPTTFNILDKSSRILVRLEGVINSTGAIGSYWYIRNYNTSGTEVAQKGISMSMAKDGTLTYAVADGAKFRSAIGAGTSSLVIGTTATTAAAGNHTHNYAGSSSAGGAATYANHLRYGLLVDNSENWSSYPWHKFAEATFTGTNSDPTITFLVSKTWGGTPSGILTAHVRTNGTKIYDSGNLTWHLKATDIKLENFVMVYTNTANTSTKIELWYKQEARWDGWAFVVLKENYREGVNPTTWTLYSGTDGNSQRAASYTSGTGTVVSTLANISNNASTATSATTATWATLIKPIASTTTASASTWNIPSGSYQVWGERFSDTRLKYTPSGGSETTITDTGDLVMWLTGSTTSNQATLNMRIDGTYYGIFSGNVTGNCSGTAGSTAKLTIASTNTASTSTNTYATNGLNIRWFDTTGKLPGQPSQYGFCLTMSNGDGVAETHQIFATQSNGSLYHRGTNGSSYQSPPAFATILDSNNYTGYTVKKDGTGASGTWGISITGNAATATTATKVATEVGTSAGARPVFYAYLGDNTRVVYNTNFTYNPSGNVLTGNVNGKLYHTGTDCSWWNDRDNAVIRITTGDTMYRPLWTLLTATSGSWGMGNHTGDDLTFNFISKTVYDSKANPSKSAQIKFTNTGAITANGLTLSSSGYGPLSIIRTDPYYAGIKFYNNGTTYLGSFSINKANGRFVRFNTDEATSYEIIDRSVVRNNTTVGTLGWTSASADTVIPTVNTIAFWNGAYSGTSSNLAYCKQGAFGTIVTKSTTDYVPIKTGDGIAKCSGNGEYLYYTIATITINSAYVNKPILFEISSRGHHFTRLEVEFASSSNTDPDLGVDGFVADGNHGFWIKKTATSTWVIYGMYSEKLGNAVLHRITGCGTSEVTVTVNMTNYGNSLPDGCKRVTYGWMALLADRALRADKASKLSTSSAIGSYTQPVYIDSDGYPTACYPMSQTSTIYDNSSGTSTIISDLTIPADTKYFKIFIFDFDTAGSHYVTNVIDIGADDGYYGGVISGSSQSQSFPCVITVVQLIVATTSNNRKQISIGRSNSWTIGASPSSSTHTLYIRKIIACT